MGDAEVGAFETEIKVHKELGHKGPVSFKYVDGDGKKGDMDIAQLYKEKGRDGLAKFILDEARTDMVVPVKPEKETDPPKSKEVSYTYRQYYEAVHWRYEQYFDVNQKGIKQLGETNPKWSRKSLEKEGY